MNTIEELQSRRNTLLAATAGLFFLWQGATLVAELLEPGQSLGLLFDLGAVIGGLGWIVVSIATVLYGRRVASARAAGVLNDERTEHNRNGATRFAYGTIIGVIALLFAASILVELNAAAVIRGLLIVVIVTPLLSFVWLERRDTRVDDDDE